ncbi:MAG: type II secretion system protein GspD [Desulfobacterales bacterium]|nr:MAG: type II secretion system protein GspD [Desulfobacterales bacterium]
MKFPDKLRQTIRNGLRPTPGINIQAVHDTKIIRYPLLALFILGLLIVQFTPLSVSAANTDLGSGSQEEFVSIDFDGVDIRDFIKFISELTHQNFVIDSRVKGKVSILSPGKITLSEAYKVFESVLEINGFAAVKAGEITKIIPRIQANSKNIDTFLEKKSMAPEDKIVTQLIRLTYARADEIKKVFTPLASKGSVIIAYRPTNTVIVTDVYSNIKRLLKIAKAFDIKDVGRRITIIPISHADAGKLVKSLDRIFAKTSHKGKRPGMDDKPVFVADERTNTIFVLAGEFETLKVKELVTAMDRQAPKSDAKIRVYYLENARAEDLAGVLTSLSGKATADEKKKKVTPLVSDQVKISFDKATNSLIIKADKAEYLVLENIIKQLDIPRPMVYIEALIMEVRDTDDFSLGVEWLGGTSVGKVDGNETGIYGGFTKESLTRGIGALPALAAGNVLTPPGGFSVGIMGESIEIGGIKFPSLGAAIRAAKKNEKVHILSTPQIMTMDNEEAQISVGENIPYLTKSGSGDQNYNTYEYKDVGVELKITPQINQGRFVRLNIYQKVEKLAFATQDNTPTTLKRTASTTVVVKDAATVVIGGLIGEDLSTTDFQVPCLGGMPLVGNLFKSTSRSGIQTNLYIFLTPRIIENPDEANAVYQEKRNDMDEIEEKTIHLYKTAPSKQQPHTEGTEKP